jgi:hypothetical protein
MRVSRVAALVQFAVVLPLFVFVVWLNFHIPRAPHPERCGPQQDTISPMPRLGEPRFYWEPRTT